MRISTFYLSKFDYSLYIYVFRKDLDKYMKDNNITSTLQISVGVAINTILRLDATFNDKKIKVIDNLDKIKSAYWYALLD